MAQILVVKPKTLTIADKKLLRESGVVCIEATDPSSVVLLQPESQPINSNDMFWAAMNAIVSDKYSDRSAVQFAKNMASLAKVSNDA